MRQYGSRAPKGFGGWWSKNRGIFLRASNPKYTDPVIYAYIPLGSEAECPEGHPRWGESKPSKVLLQGTA